MISMTFVDKYAAGSVVKKKVVLTKFPKEHAHRIIKLEFKIFVD